MDYRSEFYAARWHLDVAKRMLESYEEYGGKRFLVGVIREGARAVEKIVRAFLIREGVRGDLGVFREKVGLQYLDSWMIDDLVCILNIEKDQKDARAEFVRKDEILLESYGRWKILKISRLRELIVNIDNVIGEFSTDIKR